MKTILSIFLLISFSAHATDYYFAASGNDGNAGTLVSPMRTSAKASNVGVAGDHIYFNRGDYFTGTLRPRGGTFSNYIYYGAYGSGNQPVLLYDIPGATTGVPGRSIIYISAGRQYIDIRNLTLTDTTLNPTRSNSYHANVGNGIYIDNSGSPSYINLVSDSAYYLGQGIELSGSNVNISNCDFSNMRMIVNDVSSDNDYGANGITFENGASYITITNTYFSNNWDSSHDYTIDGGAWEFFGASKNCTITNNTVINNDGVLEYGSNTHSDVTDNNVFAFNTLINNNRIIYMHNGGDGFSLNVSNQFFYNNNIIETIDQFGSIPYLFNSNTTLAASSVILKNNIFWLAHSVTVINASRYTTGFIHTNNLFRNISGTIGFTIDGTETTTSDQIFTTVTGSPSTWNYILHAGSPAIDFGVNVGYSFAGSAPDAGVYESSTTTRKKRCCGH